MFVFVNSVRFDHAHLILELDPHLDGRIQDRSGTHIFWQFYVQTQTGSLRSTFRTGLNPTL